MKFFFVLLITFFCCFIAVSADLLNALGLGKNAATNRTTLTSNLSQDQMVGGLKEALGKGVEQAIARLGHEGGFLTNMAVKIPLPDKLRSVEKTLRVVKQ